MTSLRQKGQLDDRLEIEDLLFDMLNELKLITHQLQLITDEVITVDDLGEE